VDFHHLKPALDELYDRLNRREFVRPDPLQFLYDYEDALDREVAALVASALAYGRVVQINRSVAAVLDRMGTSPRAYLDDTPPDHIRAQFADFRHRVTSGEDLAKLLIAARGVNELHGSLRDCFAGELKDDDTTVVPALTALVSEMTRVIGQPLKHLLPSPTLGSACKRLNLFLRWMARCDDVDPGGWDQVPMSKLVIPLDTHMHRIGLALGMTQRKQTGLRTALEITAAFRSIAPGDPVRYDFALTRLGIRDEEDLDNYLAAMSHERAGERTVLNG
jgi:uncharacterized protein (TIGR02757 family)